MLSPGGSGVLVTAVYLPQGLSRLSLLKWSILFVKYETHKHKGKFLNKYIQD